MAYFEHIDDEFDFGKFKGFSLSDVMDINPDYIIWCMLNINSKICEFVILEVQIWKMFFKEITYSSSK